MEQTELLLTLLCCATMLFSFVTMLQIRRLSKKLRELAGNEERMLWHLANRAPQEAAAQQEAPYDPEELIDAVLGEVFP